MTKSKADQDHHQASYIQEENKFDSETSDQLENDNDAMIENKLAQE